jgi:aryl-phospho-beta-D-glucosidase BglC (GH1 family)
MKHIKIQLLTLTLMIVMACQVNAQHFLSTSGQAIVNENQDTILLRGMGLGGWMVQEGYMLQTAGFANPQHEIRATIAELIGEADTELFYDAWLANHVRKADVDSLKSWGFNSIRLPMHYNLFTLPIEEEPVPGEQTWLEKGFVLTDSVISWCAQNEMHVILDLHAAPGGQGGDAAISDYDETKPSLWESQDNRDKGVALWGRLAERYADEQWVAGYDLLNEPNWVLPGNLLLREFYEDCTDAIRSVDQRHIIFIEGNWWANDFTGLTPPWDDQIVYSPHKYWSTNDEATMQWVIDIRNTYDVPLYLGETGENSNVWFRDAVRLYEDLDMGWAWWPMKKIESIAGPLSIEKTPEYQTLLDYWSGNGTTPTAEFGRAALMQLAEEGLMVENCRFQKDVIDALFRQVYSNETIPFNTQQIPGVVYPSDFDMGVVGEAYYDVDVANYSVSTGNYNAWNNGWIYRNDGVDLELTSDTVDTNGLNVGWIDTDEWMQYDVEVEESGVYDIEVRVASGGSGGRFHFSMNGAQLIPSTFAPPTGGWQNWQTVTIPNVILDASDKKLRFYADQAGYNLGSFKFISTDIDGTSIATDFLSAETIDEYSIQMNTNKFMNNDLPTSPAGFEIFADGTSIPITAVSVNLDNPRIIQFSVDYILKSTEDLKISYNGNAVVATDDTELVPFTLEDVENTLGYVHPIPGRIQAEDFSFQTGVELEATTDTGGGENIGFLDPGDYLDYEVNVTSTGTYRVDYRTASLNGTGGIELQLLDADGNATSLSTHTFVPTGGWQTWVTSSKNVQLPEGRYQVRILITQSPFNLNWLDFNLLTTEVDAPRPLAEVAVFPNPGTGLFFLQGKLQQRQPIRIVVHNLQGQCIWQESLKDLQELQETIDLSRFPDGIYFLNVYLADGTTSTQKLLKASY